MLSGFFKLLFYGFLIYIIYWLFRFFKELGKKSQSPKAVRRPSGIMVKDEVCNTYLPREDALKEVYAGKPHYFCSRECRQKFLDGKKPH